MLQEGNKRLREAWKKFNDFDKPHQKRIKAKLDELSNKKINAMKPWQIGQLLHNTQDDWEADAELKDYSFDYFELLLIDHLHLHWSRARLKAFKSFWRIYHTKKSSELDKFRPSQIEALVSNSRSRISSLLPDTLNAKDFYLDPEFEYHVQYKGQTGKSLRSRIKNLKIQGSKEGGHTEHLDFDGEAEIHDFIWERQKYLLNSHRINLVSYKLCLPDSGAVDLAGCSADKLVVMEVKECATALDVGQTLAYMNELQEILMSGSSKHLKCEQGDFMGLLQQQQWNGVKGYIVAQSFASSFYHAVRGQDLLVCRPFANTTVLSQPFDAKSARDQWDLFIGKSSLN